MELALGTVQFGLAYGIAGTGQVVPEQQVRAILARAWERGVRTLDTASVYGDIESRLAGLCEGRAFRVISKIPAVPDHLSASEATIWATGQACVSHQRLGSMLAGLMCHRADDLLGARGAVILQALHGWADQHDVPLGVSCYDPATMLNVVGGGGIALAQLPGNALDQRLAQCLPEPQPGLQVYLRSVFLQGLLLATGATVAQRLPVAAAALQRWRDWYARQGLSPLVAALAIVRGFRAASTVVVGVESVDQFDEIASAWAQAHALSAPELAEQALEIIDPRYWPT